MSFDEEHLDDHHLCQREVAERDARIAELEARVDELAALAGRLDHTTWCSHMVDDKTCNCGASLLSYQWRIRAWISFSRAALARLESVPQKGVEE